MRVRKIDANQPEIVAAFRNLGCSVYQTHTVGHGFPDIVIGKNGVNVLVEIKDGSKCPSKRTLTNDERKFAEFWKGRLEIVESLDDVLKIAEGLK